MYWSKSTDDDYIRIKLLNVITLLTRALNSIAVYHKHHWNQGMREWLHAADNYGMLLSTIASVSDEHMRDKGQRNSFSQCAAFTYYSCIFDLKQRKLHFCKAIPCWGSLLLKRITLSRYQMPIKDDKEIIASLIVCYIILTKLYQKYDF